MDAEFEVRRLLFRVADGAASAAEIELLNSLLIESDALRRSTARYLCDEAFLTDSIKQSSGNGMAESTPPARRTPVIDCGSHASTSLDGVIPSVRVATLFATVAQFILQGGGSRSTPFAIAFVLLLLFTLPFWRGPSKPDPDARVLTDVPSVDGALSAPRRVAILSGLSHAAWEIDETARTLGDSVRVGERIMLKGGVAQLIFDSGVEILLEGPAQLSTVSSTRCRLDSGRLAVNVPTGVYGFTVETPLVEVIDLGTEFGIEVALDGATEVHVYRGEVLTHANAEFATTLKPELRLDEGQAARFPKNGAIEQMTASAHRFIRQLGASQEASATSPLPVSRGLALWLSSDQVNGVEDGDSIEVWRDLLIGDNRVADDAWQDDLSRRPQFVRDDEGRPGIEFDGKGTSLATRPFASGSRFTTAVVFACPTDGLASDRHGGMLLKSGEQDFSLELSLMPDRLPLSRVWVQAVTFLGEVRGPKLAPFSVNALLYSYDGHENTAALYVNGELVDRAAAPRWPQKRVSRFLGAHPEPWWDSFFWGTVYEVIHYEESLNMGEQAELWRYLADRYDIDLPEQDAR